jgi:hypothetical protein
MAAKLRRPPVPQRRRPAGVAVAAAMLVLLAVASFSHSPVAVATGAPELVELTLFRSWLVYLQVTTDRSVLPTKIV